MSNLALFVGSLALHRPLDSDTISSQGILFSVNSRTSRQEYLSLELSTGGRLQLVHAYANGSTLINVAQTLDADHWHQIALG